MSDTAKPTAVKGSTARERLYDIGFAVLVVASVALAWKAVFGPGTTVPPTRQLSPVPVRDWASALEDARGDGDASAAVTLVQFSDYECPACQVWNTRLIPAFSAKYGGDLRVVWRHWPLSYHTRAAAAARAAECAEDVGRFTEFHTEVIRRGFDLGHQALFDAGVQAGISDTLRLRRCMLDTVPVPAIASAQAFVSAHGGRGTPSFAVNGVFHQVTPDSAQLDSIIDAARLRARR